MIETMSYPGGKRYSLVHTDKNITETKDLIRATAFFGRSENENKVKAEVKKKKEP